MYLLSTKRMETRTCKKLHNNATVFLCKDCFPACLCFGFHRFSFARNLRKGCCHRYIRWNGSGRSSPCKTPESPKVPEHFFRKVWLLFLDLLYLANSSPTLHFEISQSFYWWCSWFGANLEWIQDRNLWWCWRFLTLVTEHSWNSPKQTHMHTIQPSQPPST